MNGNVYEWCQDYGYRYTDDAQINPVCTSSDYEPDRVYRGGSFTYYPDYATIVHRHWKAPTTVDMHMGLRLAL